jgi:RNA recognition motif-containing protein
LFCLLQFQLHAPEVIKPAASNLLLECAMRLYVGNLSFNTDEQQLEQLFTPLGDVASVRLIRDHATGQSRGFGFVEMADSAQGRAACEKLDQQEYEGRRLTVNEAKPQEQRSGGFSRAGAGGGGRQPRRESRW